MRNYPVYLIIIVVLMMAPDSQAQYWPGDTWYNNPLGFDPLKLHSSMGFLLPASAAGVLLLLTHNDSSAAGKLSFYNDAGLSWGYKYPETFMPHNNTGINYKLRNFLSVGVEFSVLFPADDFNSTTGFAVRPFFRFYPVSNDTWKLYFESGGGLVYTFSEFPLPTDRDGRRGLNLNGITKYGIGADIFISRSISVSFSIKHLHISNGNIEGEERNPSHDSNGFYLGISKRLE